MFDDAWPTWRESDRPPGIYESALEAETKARETYSNTPGLGPGDLEFRSALKKGLGRAMLLLRADPESSELRGELSHACKVNLVYDSQGEEDRAAYLYRLVRETGCVRYFCEELLACLAGDHAEDDVINVPQVFGVLCLAAADDPEFDRRPLGEFLFNADFEQVAAGCIYGFVGLEGLDGLMQCVRRFYRELDENCRTETGWIVRTLIETLVKRDGEAVTKAALK